MPLPNKSTSIDCAQAPVHALKGIVLFLCLAIVAGCSDSGSGSAGLDKPSSNSSAVTAETVAPAELGNPSVNVPLSANVTTSSSVDTSAGTSASNNTNSVNMAAVIEESSSTIETEQFAFVEAADELQRAWRSARVRLPQDDGGVTEARYVDLTQTPPDTVSNSLPAVVYLHGCNGFWSGTNRRIDWLASLGFVVVAPASTAREFYPQSCNVDTAEAGLFRPTLQMRWADAKEAIRQLRELPWINQEKIFLYGFSEGGVTTATLDTSDKNLNVAGRVIEAWVCEAPWQEYTGLNAPESEPVLAIVADNDPWYQASFFDGDCGSYISNTNGSQSEVINYPPWVDSHALFEAPEIGEIIRNFLFTLLAQQSING